MLFTLGYTAREIRLGEVRNCERRKERTRNFFAIRGEISKHEDHSLPSLGNWLSSSSPLNDGYDVLDRLSQSRTIEPLSFRFLSSLAAYGKRKRERVHTLIVQHACLRGRAKEQTRSSIGGKTRDIKLGRKTGYVDWSASEVYW